MNMQKVSLNQSDWDVLFPVSQFRIGTQQLTLTPLNLMELGLVMFHARKIADKLKTENIEFTQLREKPEQVITLVSIIVNEAPEILSELSKLDVEDVKRLPVVTAVELFMECLNINLKSREDLLKNFKGLGERVAELTTDPMLQ